MFGELLESRAKRARNRTGAMISVTGHVALIALALMATRKSLSARGEGERVVTLPALPPASPPIEHRTQTVAPSRAPTAPQLPAPLAMPVIAPIEIATEIPGIDLSRITSDVAWNDGDVARRPTFGAAAGATGDDGIAIAATVEKPAIALPGNPAPHYPDVLRRAGIRGEVVMQIVIDTTGRADMSTLRVLSSDHPLLTAAVEAALPRARFLPAESGGKKVRMWAVQSFVFEVK
jgi:protein TonB